MALGGRHKHQSRNELIGTLVTCPTEWPGTMQDVDTELSIPAQAAETAFLLQLLRQLSSVAVQGKLSAS